MCSGIYEKFAEAFSKAVQNLQVGDGFTEGVVQVVSLIHAFGVHILIVIVKLVLVFVWRVIHFIFLSLQFIMIVVDEN